MNFAAVVGWVERRKTDTFCANLNIGFRSRSVKALRTGMKISINLEFRCSYYSSSL
jgi:hypothetical protein